MSCLPFFLFFTMPPSFRRSCMVRGAVCFAWCVPTWALQLTLGKSMLGEASPTDQSVYAQCYNAVLPDV